MRANQSNLIKWRTLLGPAPILRSENLAHYDEVFNQYAACFYPQDFMEFMLLTEAVDATQEVKREPNRVVTRSLYRQPGHPGSSMLDPLLRRSYGGHVCSHQVLILVFRQSA